MGTGANAAHSTRQQTINGPGGMGVGPYAGVKMRHKNNAAAGNGGMGARKLSSQEEINKRLSLPADLKLPDNFIEKQAVSPTLDGPLSRATRRQSLSEIGFGRMDTYTKLDKLGEVSPKYKVGIDCYMKIQFIIPLIVQMFIKIVILLLGNLCYCIQRKKSAYR